MRQVSLRLRDGRVTVADVPPPALTPDGVLIDVRASLLSAGTERSKVAAGREGLIGKARARPDQARQVVAKARREGLRSTLAAVNTKLDQPTPLGYSAAGVVLEVGTRVRDLRPGDRVACGGGDHAVHADIVQVPGNLCVPLPDVVDFESAAFTTVASVAMHGVRQADVRVGERAVVIGLGLVGQLAGQILRAAGCHVIGIDLSGALLSRARELGSVDTAVERAVLDEADLPDAVSGCDAVIITAATQSSDPIRLGASLLRDRGRIVVVGDVRVDVPRGPYYDREIEVRFSRSYGPGRYDREYEERGLDYPIGYVRWTERRNMAAFVQLLADRRIDVAGLVVERVPIEDAPSAYERLVGAEASPLGVVLQYQPTELRAPRTASERKPAALASASTVNVLGAGSFSQRILIPGLRGAGFQLRAVASERGLSAKGAADRFGFADAVTAEQAIADPDAGLIAIATRHSSHAELTESALRAGKAVFVEKPPCLTRNQLDSLRAARDESGRPVFVGFNRRHAELAVALRDHISQPGHPIDVIYRVNAGRLDRGHWLNDPDEGGGRLLGEGCHFVDFACWLVGEHPRSIGCHLRADPGEPLASAQSFAIELEFPGGSLASIVYTAAGAPALAKEYVEAHSGARSAVLDDFRSLILAGQGRKRRLRKAQDKGHTGQFRQLHTTLNAGGSEASEWDPLDSMATTLEALAAATGSR